MATEHVPLHSFSGDMSGWSSWYCLRTACLAAQIAVVNTISQDSSNVAAHWFLHFCFMFYPKSQVQTIEYLEPFPGYLLETVYCGNGSCQSVN